MGKDLKSLVLITVLFFGLYWNARNVFTKKWDYSAAMFNKMCFETPFKTYKNQVYKSIAINFHQTTFSLALLLLEIWSHKSFVNSFSESVKIAISYKCFVKQFEENGHLDLEIIKLEVSREIDKLYENKYNEYGEISKTLSNFQNDLSSFVINNNVY